MWMYVLGYLLHFIKMKLSIYNSIIPISDKFVIIYNANTDKYLCLRFELWKQLNERTSSVNKKIVERLLDAEMIVPDDEDEVNSYVEKEKSSEKNDDVYRLIINPTIQCNFHCWYCYEKHIPSMMLPKTISSVQAFINSQLKRNFRLQLSFFGGEPLLYYKEVVKPIMEYALKQSHINDKKLTLDFTSNGYLLTQDIVDDLKTVDYVSFQITLDGCKDHHDLTRYSNKSAGSYQRIVDNIKLLIANRIHVTLRINFTRENIGDIDKISSSFSDLSEEEKSLLEISLHKVWQEGLIPDAEITPITRHFYEEGFKVTYNLMRDRCYGDSREGAVINYNGDVYKCTAVDFATTKREGHISEEGEIIWENNSLEKRMESKYANTHCLSCWVFPICHGGCTQRALSQAGKNTCLFNYDESQKDAMVMERLVYNIRYNPVFKTLKSKLL